MTTDTKHVYEAISNVKRELATVGIGKDRKNAQQGYSFRGIDDVLNAIARITADHGLVIVPRYSNRVVTERQTRNGGAMFYVSLDGEFDFVSMRDGSCHTARTFGEAMDSADKATNKAMSAAYKYAVILTFSIPTVGDDADYHSPEVATAPPPPPEHTRARALAGVEKLRGLLAKRMSEDEADSQAARFGEIATTTDAERFGILCRELSAAVKAEMPSEPVTE